MKLSYAITVCNELNEIQTLVTFLLEHKRAEDEVVITYDSKNGSKDVEDYLRAKSVNSEFNWHSFEFDNDFAKLKNHTKKMCSGDFIFHLDADEVPHVQKWGWVVNENGWVNYPDYQARVFRNIDGIEWVKPVHEYISGPKTYAHLPPNEELSLYHPKTIDRQEKQNNLYNGIQRG